MNCQEFWDNIPEMGAHADLKHTAECEACAARLARYRSLEGEFRTLAAEMRQMEAPARVEAGLIAAFRSQNRPVRRESARQWWGPALSWAAAAGVLIMAALLSLNPQRPQRPLPAHPSAPAGVEMASVPDVPDWYAADADDGFLPLPNTSRMDPNEDVNVVRVEVPRSAMLEVGLAVTADRVSELVEADVVLGQDGLARAIRFVDE